MILSYSPIYVLFLCNSEFDAQTWRSDCQPMHSNDVHEFFEKIKRQLKKARKDLAVIYHRPSLELSARGTKPQAPFYMKAKER
jgi:hypothetical protein